MGVKTAEMRGRNALFGVVTDNPLATTDNPLRATLGPLSATDGVFVRGGWCFPPEWTLFRYRMSGLREVFL